MLKHRVATSIVIVSMLLMSAYRMPSTGVLLLLIVATCLAMWEFYRMLDEAGMPVFRYYGTFFGILMVGTTYVTYGPSPAQGVLAHRWEMFVLFIAVIAICLRQFPEKNNPQPIQTLAGTLMGILYVPFLFNFVTRILFTWDGAYASAPIGRTGRMLLLYLVLVVKVTDIGAYFTGRRFGRHKLFPRLSPAKTWEGLAGGVAAAVLASLAFCLGMRGAIGELHMGLHDAVILGVILAIVGALGDLFESLLKRASGVKDSGRIMPGMGGILDVLDSLLFGAPALYFYALFFLSRSGG